MDAADLERVYEAFQDFHATLRRSLAAGSHGSTAVITCRARWCSPRSGATPKTWRRRFRHRPRALQRFLAVSPWDDEGVIGRLQEYLGSRLEDPQAVWVLDGSDFPKQGVKSVGVIRQYCGALGKIASCQAGVFLAHVGPRGRALVEPAPVAAAGMDIGCGALCGGRGAGSAAGVPEQDAVGDGYAGASVGSWLPEGAVGGWGFRLRDVAHAAGGNFEGGNAVRAGRAAGSDGVAVGTHLDQTAGPTRPIRDGDNRANPSRCVRSAKPWPSAARRCRQRPGGR